VWIGPIAAFGKQVADQITPQALQEFNQEVACRHLELGDGVADDFQRMDEAEAVRVELLVQCGLVHQSTDYVMGNEQGIQFLDHADRFQAAEGATRQALVGVNFIDYEGCKQELSVRLKPGHSRILQGQKTTNSCAKWAKVALELRVERSSKCDMTGRN
jgi:hypothetical protein